jgi:thiol:disulfide interchange protein DsbA
LTRFEPHAALIWIASLFVAFSCPVEAFAQQPRINYEYRLIAPQAPATGERIEVVEFFWYGCPYCNQLQTYLESWSKRKPPDVELRRIPAVFRESWVPYARVYYTLEALGEVNRLHQIVYRTHHIEHENLSSEERAADWAVRQGIDRATWLAAYNSPGVADKIRKAIADTRAYSIEGTPSLVVDGRYLTSTGMTETVGGVIPILDELIRLAREDRTQRK